MRTISLYIPALICAGSMLVCVRMMSRNRGRPTHDQHRDERRTEPRDDEHVT
jgi:hypothetical protein